VIACLWRMKRKAMPGLFAIVIWLLLPGTLDTLHLGQLNSFAALMVCLGVMGFAARSKWAQLAGGLLVGIAGTIRIFPLALIALTPWGKKWPFAAGIVGGAAGMILAGLVGAPLVAWREFVRVIVATLGQSAPPGAQDAILLNQSLLAFWRKLSFNGEIGLTLQGRDLGELTSHAVLPPALATGAAYASIAIIIAITLYALWRLYRATGDHMPVVWSLILVAALIVSPYTWWHYLAITGVMFLGLMDAQERMRGPWRLLLPVGYLLVVAQRAVAWVLAVIPFIALSSALLAGLLLWWLVLIRYAVRVGSVQGASGH
jgi:hypothetical protein